jgi:hypothetical protein
VFSEENVAWVSQLVSPVVSIDKAAMLERDVSAEEIKDTIFSMKTNKSPGTEVIRLIFSRLHGMLWGQMWW